ncbi:MAG: hypothetical protein ACREQV_17115, partial [Candidatus Binatia bacterium]
MNRQNALAGSLGFSEFPDARRPRDPEVNGTEVLAQDPPSGRVHRPLTSKKEASSYLPRLRCS